MQDILPGKANKKSVVCAAGKSYVDAGGPNNIAHTLFE
jgi:hypothetical protein